MNELTQILAIIVVVSHCVAIFWPRKPLKVPTDENGMPVLWRNENEASKDVACVWWDEAESAAVENASMKQSPAPIPMTPYNAAANSLGVNEPQGRRSVA